MRVTSIELVFVLLRPLSLIMFWAALRKISSYCQQSNHAACVMQTLQSLMFSSSVTTAIKCIFSALLFLGIGSLCQVVNLQGWMDHGTNEHVLTLESTAYYGQLYLSSRALKLVGTTPWMCSALLGFNNRSIITWGSILRRLMVIKKFWTLGIWYCLRRKVRLT